MRGIVRSTLPCQRESQREGQPLHVPAPGQGACGPAPALVVRCSRPRRRWRWSPLPRRPALDRAPARSRGRDGGRGDRLRRYLRSIPRRRRRGRRRPRDDAGAAHARAGCEPEKSYAPARGSTRATSDFIDVRQEAGSLRRLESLKQIDLKRTAESSNEHDPRRTQPSRTWKLPPISPRNQPRARKTPRLAAPSTLCTQPRAPRKATLALSRPRAPAERSHAAPRTGHHLPEPARSPFQERRVISSKTLASWRCSRCASSRWAST